ncbi:hypothetical protein [Nostoc sp. NMS7]|nr:hypothetical protein [Nostoc sp. NMS7]
MVRETRGHGKQGGIRETKGIINAQCPMPNAQCPMPNAQVFLW